MTDKSEWWPNIEAAYDLFFKSYDVVKRNLNTFAILYLIPFLTLLGRVILADRDSSFGNRWASNSGVGGLPTIAIAGVLGAGLLLSLLLIVVSFFLRAMTYQLELEVAEGKTPTLGHLFDKAKRYWLRLAGLSIFIGVLAIFGLILFIIPGLIVIRRYFFAPYLMLEKDLPITLAMHQSAELTKPHAKRIYAILLIIIVISFLNAFPIIGPIAALLLTIAYSVAPAIIYHQYKSQPKSASQAS